MFQAPRNSKRASSENHRSSLLPLKVDREILRSVALFGLLETNVSFFQRNPSYQYFGPQVKRQIKERRAYFELVQGTDYPKFVTYCDAYNIPVFDDNDNKNSSKEEENTTTKEASYRDEVIAKEKETMAMTPYYGGSSGKCSKLLFLNYINLFFLPFFSSSFFKPSVI